MRAANKPVTEGALLRLGSTIQLLKQVPRTGWLLRGVAPGEAESVAAHTAGMSLIALALAEAVAEPLDRSRLLAMCLLHDLAEVVLGDVPSPALRYLPPDAKAAAERQALADLLGDLPFADQWLALWEEFEAAVTPEARLARDADRLDMLLQAATYESAGREGLDEFWQNSEESLWYFTESATLYQLLLKQRTRLR